MAFPTLKDDYQDLLRIVDAQFLWIMNTIYTGAINNPGSTYDQAVNHASLGIVAQYDAENTLNPSWDICPLDPALAFDKLLTRHGVGATDDDKWNSVKTWCQSHSLDFVDRWIRSLKDPEETLPSLGELYADWYEGMENFDGDDDEIRQTMADSRPPPNDLQRTEIRETEDGATKGFILQREIYSPSVGISIRQVNNPTYDAQTKRTDPNFGTWEIV